MKSTFLRFVVVGGVGFIVDAGIVALLVRAGVTPILARLPALTAAIFTTWFLNRTFSFRVRQKRSAREIFRYFTVALSTAALNFALYSALTLAGVWPVPAVAVSTCLLLTLSFVGYRRFAFRESGPSGAEILKTCPSRSGASLD